MNGPRLVRVSWNWTPTHTRWGYVVGWISSNDQPVAMVQPDDDYVVIAVKYDDLTFWRLP